MNGAQPSRLAARRQARRLALQSEPRAVKGQFLLIQGFASADNAGASYSPLQSQDGDVTEFLEAGVTVAALSLREKGLIEASRGHVRILNRQRLEAESCECYGIIREEFRNLYGSLSWSARLVEISHLWPLISGFVTMGKPGRVAYVAQLVHDAYG